MLIEEDSINGLMRIFNECESVEVSSFGQGNDRDVSSIFSDYLS